MPNGRKKRVKNIKVLTLIVKDDKVEWKLAESEGGDKSKEYDRDDEELRFDKDTELYGTYESILLELELLDLINSLYRDRKKDEENNEELAELINSLSRDRTNSAAHEAVSESLHELLNKLVRHLGAQLAADEAISSESLRETLDKLVRHLGAQLYRFLFRGKINAKLREVLKETNVDLVRVEIIFQTSRNAPLTIDQSSTWPWELTRLPPDHDDPKSTGTFLGLITDLALTRKVRLRPPAAVKVAPPVKILFVVSTPEGLDPVDGRFVSEWIGKAFGSSAIIEMIHKRKYPPTRNWKSVVTYDAFVDKVEKERPHIIHLIAHGRQTARGGEVAFATKDGSQDWVSGEDLAQSLTNNVKRHDLKLVFLQACESALPDPFVGISSVAQSLAFGAGVPAVLGMQARIEQQVAGRFAKKFYECLADQEPVDVAVKEGRRAITRGPWRKDTAFALPVIYLASYEISFKQKRPPASGRQTENGPKQEIAGEALGIRNAQYPSAETLHARNIVGHITNAEN